MYCECKGKEFNQFIDLLKLVRKIYKGCNLFKNAVLPYELIEEDSIFKNSYFITDKYLFNNDIFTSLQIKNIEDFLAFLKTTNPNNPKNKSKFYLESEGNNLYCYRDDGNENKDVCLVGEYLSMFDEDYISMNSAYDEIYKLKCDNKDNIYKYNASSLIGELTDYATLTLNLTKDGEYKVIFTHKLFPNIKKVNYIDMEYIKTNEDIFPVIVTGTTINLLDEPLMFKLLIRCSKY